MQLAGTDATSLTSVFKGMIASLEPEFGQGTTLGFRAYDGSHLLHQTKRAATYQNMTAADIARKVGQRAGVDEGTIDSAGPAHDFVQQNNETDWEFLWRLAQRIDFEVLVIDHKLYFRKAGPPAGTQDITLKWGDNLISFRPRVTGVQQVDQVTVRARNPARSQPFEATASVSQPVSHDRDQALRRLRGAEGRDDGRRRPAGALARTRPTSSRRPTPRTSAPATSRPRASPRATPTSRPARR